MASKPEFVHLHVHSQYSLLDGLASPTALVKRAKALGMPALALTDHGLLAGTVELVTSAKREGLRGIVGCEVYLAHTADRSPLPGREDMASPHLVLLAESPVGLQNLYWIVSNAHAEGYHFKPRTTLDLLAGHHEGLVALSACMSGNVAAAILEGNDQKAEVYAAKLGAIFGKGSFYLEMQEHPGDSFRQINQGILRLARRTGLPIVATNDVHYLEESDAEYQRTLSRIGKGSGQSADDYHMKPAEEMVQEFGAYPDAWKNTLAIAERCAEISFPSRVAVPRVPELRGLSQEQVWSRFVEKVWEGLARRFKGQDPPVEYVTRLSYELETVQQTGYASYLLLVADICRFCREKSIRYGPRGSAAGSIVCWGLGISEPDPIKYNLFFERFLNPDRVDMPDVDVDFEDEERDRVFGYLQETYGEECVGHVATFGTLGARQAVKDVGKLREFDFQTMQRLTKAMGNDPKLTLEDALQVEAVQQILGGDPKLADVVYQARRLEGVVRHSSTHAAGAVISERPLAETAPLMRVPRAPDQLQVQFPGDQLQYAGLLKMDLLGLDNLTVLDHALRLIWERHGEALDPWALPEGDDQVFDMLCKGRVYGVFQLGTEGGRRLTTEMQPRTFEDLAVLVALNRPGPDSKRYLAVRRGLEPYESPHPLIDPIVRPTHGVIVYQEQILEVAKAVAGFTYGRADVLRRAVGKKIEALMKSMHVEFVEGAVSHSKVSRAEAERLWEIFVPFANYGFNRAHSVCYAALAYQTAWLKCHYPIEFMCAVLEVGSDSKEKTQAAVAEALALGLTVLGPDVNRSQVGFAIETEGVGTAAEGRSASRREVIRFGLGAVAGVGKEIARAIVEAAPYTQLGELVERPARVPPKLALEALAKAGACQDLGSRAALLDVIDRVVGAVQATRKKAESGQLALFDMTEQVPTPSDRIPEVALEQILRWERELLGVYVSENPVREARLALDGTATTELELGTRVRVVGELHGVRVVPRKKDNRLFGIATLADEAGSVALVAFTRVYSEIQEAWHEGALVLVEGEVGEHEGEVQVSVDSLSELQPGDYVAPEKPRIVAWDVGAKEPFVARVCLRADDTVAFVEVASPEVVRFPVLRNPTPYLRAAKLALTRPGPRAVRILLGEDPVIEASVGVTALEEIKALEAEARAERAPTPPTPGAEDPRDGDNGSLTWGAPPENRGVRAVALE